MAELWLFLMKRSKEDNETTYALRFARSDVETKHEFGLYDSSLFAIVPHQVWSRKDFILHA